MDQPLPGLSEPVGELNSELPLDRSAESPLEQIPVRPVAGPSWLRLAYALEFLIALLAILNLWSEIGGEGHLELMPWHVKLVCILGLAWCCVRFTASVVEQQEFWTLRSIRWFAGILLLGIAMGGITYYYHLQEEQDEGDDDTSTAMIAPAAGILSYDAS